MTLKRSVSILILASILAIGAFGQTAPPVVTPSQSIIQYTEDYTSLVYLDSAGQKVTVSFLDSDKFNGLVVIRDQQLQAIRENVQGAENYNRTVKNAQISVDAGREAPPLPTMPRARVVSNEGKVSYTDFAPPLLSLVTPVVNAPSSGSIKSTVTTPDPAAQSQAQLTVVMNMLRAIIAALSAKGIM